MMSRQPLGGTQKFPKYRIPVRIVYADQSIITGTVFVRQGQRVLDVMCDDRPFFPVLMVSGTILANKRHVRQIDILGLPEIVKMQDDLPEFDMNYLRNNSW